MLSYSDAVIDHFERPRNVVTDGTCARSVVGRAGSKGAGSLIEFCLQVREGLIERAHFRAWGCPHTIATASWLTEALPGQPLASAHRLDLNEVAGELGLPPEKWHCVLTAEDALRAASAEPA